MKRQLSGERIRELLNNKEIREGLIAYYKWIVNLAVIVLTLSISLVGLIGSQLFQRWLFLIGWILLAMCIFFNWLTIKRLVTFPINEALHENERTWINYLYEHTLDQVQCYAILQNILFLVGSLLVFLGFIINWLAR